MTKLTFQAAFVSLLLSLISYDASAQKSSEKASVADPPKGFKLTTFGTKGKMYHKGWIDFNKNGVKDVYEDPSADINARIEDLLSQMTMEEKTCQMVTLYGYRRVLEDALPTPQWKEKLWKDGVGAIDEHLNSFKNWTGPLTLECPYIWPASRHAWAINEVQRFFIEETRLGIPADMTNEGIRGVEAYKATNFPTQLGMGATWDKELVYQEGRITGREGHLLGYTNIYAPILDVTRDQRWGRNEEVFGEDPYLVAELGVAMTSGLQKDFQVAATGKHFAIYSVGKGAREGMARCDPHETLHEVENIHMYPWRDVIARTGMLGAMCSYNDYDGVPIAGSHYWMYDRLRGDFGFRGYVVSDSDAVEYLNTKHKVASDMKEAVRQSVEAGLNVRCTFRSPDSFVLPLRELIKEGAISMDVIDSRVRDVLRVKFLVGLFDHPYQNDYKAADHEVYGPENNAVALKASQECLVLLKNNGVLPLNDNVVKSVAVIGPNACEVSFVNQHYGPLATDAVSVLDGLKHRLGDKVKINYAKGCPLVDAQWPESEIYGFEPDESDKALAQEAVEAALKSDVVIAVVGGNRRTCGENKTRTELNLPPGQQYLLRELKKTGKPVVMVVIAGRPLTLNWEDRNLDAILYAWYPGTHGGTAVSQALFGDINPGGKLPVTFPRCVGQIPFNFPYKPNSQVNGYTGLGPKGKSASVDGALYDFGYGLSYTTFEYSDIKSSAKNILPSDTLTVSCKVKNTGKCAGDEVLQLYIHDDVSSITVYEKQLRGFERVTLAPGEEKTVSFTLAPNAFEMLDADMKRTIEPGTFGIYIGSSSTDLRLGTTVNVMDPANPVKMTEGTNVAGVLLPVDLKDGDEISFQLDLNKSFSKVNLSWRMDSKCRFVLETTAGGGQFFKIYEADAVTGMQQRCWFKSTNGSELKLRILSGHGTLVDVENCPAILNTTKSCKTLADSVSFVTVEFKTSKTGNWMTKKQNRHNAGDADSNLNVDSEHTILIDNLKDFKPSRENTMDKWGGHSIWTPDSVTSANPEGFWRTGVFRGRPVMVDPDGHVAILHGVNTVSPGVSANYSETNRTNYASKYADAYRWGREMSKFLNDNAVNFYSAGIKYTDQYRDEFTKEQEDYFQTYCKNRHLSHVENLAFMRTFQWRYKKIHPGQKLTNDLSRFALLFDPAFDRELDIFMAKVASYFKNDKSLIGYYLDNELAFVYSGKRKEQIPYNPINLSAWLSYQTSCDAGENARAFAEKFMREHGVQVSPDAVTDALQEEFLATVTELYYSKICAAVRKWDPNHLIMGNRLHGLPGRTSIIVRLCAQYCDVLSYNYYSRWEPDESYMAWFQSFLGKKPFIITEFYTKDVNYEFDNSDGGGWMVHNQADRGRFYQNFCIRLLRCGCAGWQWFELMDKGVEGSSNKGLITADYNYEKYKDFLKLYAQMNLNVYTVFDWLNPEIKN